MHEISIVKIGSSLLVQKDGSVDIGFIKNILSLVYRHTTEQNKIMIVTSGAVALGRALMKKTDADRRVAASVGQMHLMKTYVETADVLGIRVGELLLSRPHLIRREQFLKLQELMAGMFANGVIPIINENDVLVSDDEWSFGDNDTLASSLAVAFSASRLIMASMTNGLYTGNPDTDTSVEHIGVVENVDAELMKYCEGGSSLGRGGMLSKLKAARLCSAVGIETYIVDGHDIHNLETILKGNRAGTYFMPRHEAEKIKNRDRWILSAKNSAASIEIDDGAAVALQKGKSLLAVGIKRVYGTFDTKEIVGVVNNKHEGIAFGVVDVSSAELGTQPFREQKNVQVMHADNIMYFGN